MNFLEKLNKLLLEKNITKIKLSRISGIPYTTIMSFYDASKGTDNIKLSTLRKLSKALDVSLDYLVDDTIENDINTDENYFEFIAEDDAMYPLLDIGDTALIYKQDFIEDKATLLFNLDNKTTIRKFILSDDKSFYKLIASNSYYKDIIININEINRIKILGKVIEAQNKSAFK